MTRILVNADQLRQTAALFRTSATEYEVLARALRGRSLPAMPGSVAGSVAEDTGYVATGLDRLAGTFREQATELDRRATSADLAGRMTEGPTGPSFAGVAPDSEVGDVGLEGLSRIREAAGLPLLLSHIWGLARSGAGAVRLKPATAGVDLLADWALLEHDLETWDGTDYEQGVRVFLDRVSVGADIARLVPRAGPTATVGVTIGVTLKGYVFLWRTGGKWLADTFGDQIRWVADWVTEPLAQTSSAPGNGS